MDEGADGGGAFHGVGEPDVEGELGGLTHSAEEDEDGAESQQAITEASGFNGFQDGRDVEAADVIVEKEDANQEADITDAGGNESLLGCLGGGAALVPEAD